MNKTKIKSIFLILLAAFFSFGFIFFDKHIYDMNDGILLILSLGTSLPLIFYSHYILEVKKKK